MSVGRSWIALAEKSTQKGSKWHLDQEPQAVTALLCFKKENNNN